MTPDSFAAKACDPRKLTAQEAFEQEGYIIHHSEQAYEPGDIVENTVSNFIPIGSQLVVTGKLKRSEVKAYLDRIGFNGYLIPRDGKFYKAVAE